MPFKTKLTLIGHAKLAEALANNQTINPTHIAVGDGNGEPTVPNAAQTALVNEVFRGLISDKRTVEDNPRQTRLELIIPAPEGGWTIHEAGIFDDEGDMIAVANHPASEKPLPADGATREMVIRLHIETSNAGLINLTVDPAAVTATRQWVSEQLTPDNTGALAKAANLGDLPSPSAGRGNLGLSPAATTQVQATETDTTPGRLLVNGAHGLGGMVEIPDANTAVITGLYSLPISAGAANSPLPGVSGTLLVITGGTDSDHVSQTWQSSDPSTENRVFMRHHRGGANGWSPWQEVTTSAPHWIGVELVHESTAIAGASRAGLAAHSPNAIAFYDSGTQMLRRFERHALTGAWAAVGTPLFIPRAGNESTSVVMATLSETDVALRRDASGGSGQALGRYSWTGATYVQVGNVSENLSTGWGGAGSALDENSLVLARATSGDQVYVWSTDTQRFEREYTGSQLPSSSECGAATLAGPRYVHVNDGNSTLGIRRWTGNSGVAEVLQHALGFSVTKPGLCSLNSHDFILVDEQTHRFTFYRYRPREIRKLPLEVDLGAITDPVAVCPDGRDIVLYESTSKKLKTFRLRYVLDVPHSPGNPDW